jgi:DNA-binding MarR family transcriptional regulator
MSASTTVATLAQRNQQLMFGMRDLFVELVAGDTPDLSSRQYAVLFKVYCAASPQETARLTVRDLASDLNVSKPAITRALDRLSEYDYVQRKTDPMDRRSVLINRTARGQKYFAVLTHSVSRAFNNSSMRRTVESLIAVDKRRSKLPETVDPTNAETTAARAARKAQRATDTPPTET